MKTTFIITMLCMTTLATVAGATVPGTEGGFSSDAVNAPATCTQSACTQETTTGPVDTPRVSPCIPSEGNCIIHPTIESVHLSDGTTVPAACTTAGAIPPPETTLLAAGFVAVAYDVDDTNVVIPNAGVGTISDIEVINMPPVTLELCDNTACPWPVLTPGGVTGGVTLSFSVAGQDFSRSVPLALP